MLESVDVGSIVPPGAWELLSRLPRLRRVTLRLATEADVEGVAQLTRLTFLRLNACADNIWEVDGCPYVQPVRLAALSRLSKLQWFTLDEKLTPHGISFISSLTSLTHLAIWNRNSDVREQDVHHWTRLTSLHTLQLKFCNGVVTDGAMTAITSIVGLRELDLEGTGVMDESICHLTALTALSRLKLSGMEPECAQLFSHIMGLEVQVTDPEGLDEGPEVYNPELYDYTYDLSGKPVAQRKSY